MSYHLQMNGTSDVLYYNPNPVTFDWDELIIDCLISSKTAWDKYLSFSAGTNYLQRNGSNQDSWNASNWTVYVNGATVTNNTDFIPLNTRITLRIVAASKTTNNNIDIFANNTAAAGAMPGNLYGVTLKNAGVEVFRWDLTLGNTQDQSGNGRNGTLVGGTWVNDGGASGTTYSEVDTITTGSNLTSVETLLYNFPATGTVLTNASVASSETFVSNSPTTRSGSGTIVTGAAAMSNEKLYYRFVAAGIVQTGGNLSSAEKLFIYVPPSVYVGSGSVQTGVKMFSSETAYIQPLYHNPNPPIPYFPSYDGYYSVIGQFVNYTGAVTVMLMNSTGSSTTIYNLTTDSNGRFSFKIPKEEVRVLITIGGKLVWDERLWSWDADVKLPLMSYRG